MAAVVVAAAEVEVVAVAEMVDWYLDEPHCCRRLPRRLSGRWAQRQRSRRRQRVSAHAYGNGPWQSPLFLLVGRLVPA